MMAIAEEHFSRQTSVTQSGFSPTYCVNVHAVVKYIIGSLASTVINASPSWVAADLQKCEIEVSDYLLFHVKIMWYLP